MNNKTLDWLSKTNYGNQKPSNLKISRLTKPTRKTCSNMSEPNSPMEQSSEVFVRYKTFLKIRL